MRLITTFKFKYGISRMTAWPVITDKWVSYNNDVTHFSRKRRSPTSFPSFTVAYFYHGISYASAEGFKSHLRLMRGSMILDNIQTRFLGGDLYASIYGKQFFNFSHNTLQLISETIFYTSDDPSNSSGALKREWLPYILAYESHNLARNIA